MERFKTNIKLIRNRFRAIENHFIFLSDNISKDHLFKSNSHKSLIKRPYIKPRNNSKEKNKNNDKIYSGNQLDQIGNDDLIFNNDKLITNIKIDNIEEFNQKGLNYVNDEESKDMSLKTVRKISPKKSNLSPTREAKNKKLQKVQSPKNRKKIANNNNNNNDALLLDCVKNQFHNTTSGKVCSTKSFINNKNLMQTNRLKNINQFINKPNETNFNESSQKRVIMTPVIKKQSPSKISSHKSFNKINLKFANPNSSNIDFQNDNFNLSPVPGTGAHNSSRGKSTSNNKSIMHFPNKSVMKNMDKLYKELQKIFGEKVQLNDDLYQNMSDSDKKNTINFLLDSLKEIYSINKVALTKNDGYKEIADSKEKQLKEAKNEIKELKKDNANLNKIIKTNIQMNRKLSQNIDNLKSQLEKEKNKSKEVQTKGKSANKTVLSSNKIKHRNDSGGLSATSSKKMKGNISQGKFRKTSDFINRKKVIDNNKSKDRKSIKKKINGNTKKKNSNNINSIKVDEKKDNPNNNNNKDLLNDLIDPIISDINLNNDINLVENLNIDKNDNE